MEIELSVKISENDSVKINRESNRKEYSLRLFLYYSFASIFLVCSLILITNDLVNNTFSENWLDNTFYISLVLLFFFVVPQLWIYNYKKVYRSNKNAKEIIHYIIDDEFIGFKTPFSQGKTSWETISKVVELKEWFLLKYAATIFYALPKNQLNPAQQSWLRYKVTKK
jgi:hypothetical protein